MKTSKMRKNKDTRKKHKLNSNSPEQVEEVDLLGISEQKDFFDKKGKKAEFQVRKVSQMTESSGPPQPEKLPTDLSVDVLVPSQQNTQTSTVKVITRTVTLLDDNADNEYANQYKVKSFNSNQMNVEIKNGPNKDLDSAGIQVQQQVKDVVKNLEYTLHNQKSMGNNKIDNQQGLDQDINKLNRVSEMEPTKQHDEESEITLNDIGVKNNDQVSNLTGYTEQHQVSSSIVEASGRDALRDFSSKRKMRESKNANKNIDTMIETIRRRTARQEMHQVLNPKAVKVIELVDDSEAERMMPATTRSVKSGKKGNDDDLSSEGAIRENHLKFIQSYEENSIGPQSFVAITTEGQPSAEQSPPRGEITKQVEKKPEDSKLFETKDNVNKSVKLVKTENEQEDLEIMILDQNNTHKFQSLGNRSSSKGSRQSGMSYDSDNKSPKEKEARESRKSRKSRKPRSASKSPPGTTQLEQVNIQYEQILKPAQEACLSPVSNSTLPQTEQRDTTKTQPVVQKPNQEISRFRAEEPTPTAASPRSYQQFRDRAPASREISPKQINVTKVNKDTNPAAFEIYPIQELTPQKRRQFKEMKNPLVEKPLPEWNAFGNPQLNTKRTDEDYKKELEVRRKTRERQIASVLRRQNQRATSKSETQAQLLSHLQPNSEQVPLTDRSEQEARVQLNQFLNQPDEPVENNKEDEEPPMETEEAVGDENPVSMRIKDRVLSPEHHKKIQDLRKKYSLYRKQQEKRLASRSPRPNFSQPKEISSIKVDNLYKQTQNNIKAHDQRQKKNNFKPVDNDPSKRGDRSGSLGSLRSLESTGVKSVKTEGGLITPRYGKLARNYQLSSDVRSGQLPPPRTLRKSVLAQEQFLQSSLINDNKTSRNDAEAGTTSQLTKAKSPQPILTRIPSLNRITQNASRRKERATEEKETKSAPKQFRSKFQQNLAQKQKSLKDLKFAQNRPDSAIRELPNKQVASIMLSPEKYVTTLLNTDPRKMLREEKGLADLRSNSRQRQNKNKQGNKPAYMLNTESKDAKLGIQRSNGELEKPENDAPANDLSMIKEEMTMSYSVNKTAGGLNLSLKDNIQRAFDCYDKEVEVQMFNQLGSMNSNLANQKVPSVLDIEGKEQLLKTVEESVDLIQARAQQEVAIGPNGSSTYASLPSTRKKTNKLEQYALRKALNEQEPQPQKYKLRREAKDYNPKLAKSTFQCLMKSHTSSIGMIIILFLEGFDPNGPSLDSFKLAMLNRTFKTIVQGLYKVDTLIGFGINYSRQRFIDMLQSEPVYDKYQSDKRYVRNLRAAWKNPVFGNSVFTPIYGAHTGIGGLKEKRLDNKTIVKRNSLKKQIVETPIDLKTGGGYYVLRNVQTNQRTFLDIYILIEGGISNKTDLKRMQKWNTFSSTERKIVPNVKVPDAGYFTKSISKHVLNNPIVKPNSSSGPDQIESRIDKLLKKSKQKISDDKKAKDAKKFNSLAETPNLWTKGLRSECMSPSQAFSPRANNGKTTAESGQKPIGTFSPRLVQDKRPAKRKVKSPATTKDKNLFNRQFQFSIPKEEIKLWLNGYARIIEFGTNFVDKGGESNPTVDFEQNYVLSVAEGHFKLGQFSGYARCLDNEGECKVGFWKLDTASGSWEFPPSRPWGKFAHYYKDGSFKSPDGIYLGNDDEWNHLQKKKQITDYIKNERPVQSTKETKVQQKLKADELAKQRALSPLAQQAKKEIKNGIKKLHKEVKEVGK